MTTSEALERRLLFAGVMVLGPKHAGVAQEEIRAAIERHPDKATELMNSTRLLKPTHERMRDGADFVYRGHVRELLERVAAGRGTRLGTAAEGVLVCMEISARIPLHGAPAGLYHRFWMQAFPDHPIFDDQESYQKHHEALNGREIDTLEAEIRNRTAALWRS